MKKILITITAIIVSCVAVFAQEATIEGNIKQIDSTTALSGVAVYLEKTNLGASTNGNGNYIIKNVPTGNYTLVVSAIGYFTLKKEISIGVGETLKADFTLVESVTALSEVVIMTGGNTGVKNIPGSVYYISPKEIQRFSYTDINRTLRTVPGINMQEEDGFGLRPNIGLRGTGVERSSKITVMEDGVLMAPAPYAAPAAYYFPTIGRMQAVEILKGSSQIKYGPYTTGGAINLISTQIPNEFGGRINLLGGSFGGRNLHAFVGNSHKNFAYMVETFQYGSNGFKQLDGGGNTGFDKKDYLAKFRINTNDSAKIYQSLTFKIGQTTETSNQTYLGLTQEDFNNDPYRLYSGSQVDQMNTEQSQFSLSHVAKFSKLFDIKTTAYRSDFKRNWYKLDKVKDSTGTKTSIGDILENPNSYNDAYAILKGTTSALNDALFVKANNRSYYAQGVQTVLGFNFTTNKITHDIDLGFRIHQDQIDRFQWNDGYAMDNGVMKLTNAGIQGTESNRIETANALATYLQYKLNIGKLTLTPGVRYENITLSRQDYGKNDPTRLGNDLSERSNTVDVFIPGIGLDYRFNKHLSTFAGVHKGFSPPGSKEGTKPEESINYELGTRYAKNALSGQAVIFFNDYSNLLGTDLSAAGGGGTTDLFNGGEVQTKGLEFQLTYDLLATQKKSAFSVPLTIVYTYTDAKFQNDFDSDFEGWGAVAAGDQFPYMANNQFSFILGLEHRKFSINLSGRYMDEMRTAPGQGDIPTNEKTDSYFVIDASASYNLHKNMTLFANATNLTNQVYVVARRPAGLRPGMPRAFNIGLKANF
ncbi:TonB-dependent receptor [uncultured Sunxiuqinia sp.]|uniref:TonB-dependent receptor domain-containing protein n=1 Tax=uncultured Sunxiuqinia sp. TaxID=1573825 RepID=UPI0030DC65BC|tara:strand:+ start:8472 stop:10916 length:2445 start_codon:yes stop_codon:yes gene_type:complete